MHPYIPNAVRSLRSRRAWQLAFLATAVSYALVPVATAERVWWDGTRDDGTGPPGKLLSDNPGYWGERIATGVDYSYTSAPDNPGDFLADDKAKPGRRLLDGVPAGNWHAPVGMVNAPLVVTLDFKRVCTFAEVDVCSRSRKLAVLIESADRSEGPWRRSFERPLEKSPDAVFHRFELPEKTAGRYLRLTVNAVSAEAGNYLTYLEEVVVWGDSAAPPPVVQTAHTAAAAPENEASTLASITGIPTTRFSVDDFQKWKSTLGPQAQAAAVWSRLPTWDRLSNQSILPGLEQTGRAEPMVMSRNETENSAMALTNTNLADRIAGTVHIGPFHRNGSSADEVFITGSLRIGGGIRSRNEGTVVGPLFQPGNIPAAALLEKYLTNVADIMDFPRVSLPPAGSAVLWLAVETRDAPAGDYTAELVFEPADGTPKLVSKLGVQVLDVTLPDPRLWLQTWSGTTGMFPFVYGDRMEREVAYKQSLGITVWNGLPVPGSAAELARKHGQTFHHVPLLPADLVQRGYSNRLGHGKISSEDEKAVADRVRQITGEARALNLADDHWYGELWDEPGRGNMAAFGALANLVKHIDPAVRLFANPCFWEESATAPDEVVAPLLEPWYRSAVDVSVPLEPLLRDHPRSRALFDHPREVRASYRVSSHGDKSEAKAQVDSYRRQAWDAWLNGYDGWGFYSYFAPLGDPWDDLDGLQPDYQMVYPGPRGPVASRTSENLRQGWEDYRLLTLLRQRGLENELAALLRDYRQGGSPENLRLRALRLLAAPH